MESSSSLGNGLQQPTPQKFLGREVRALEVVDARHDTGQIIVWAQSVFGSLANHRQAGFESLETPNRQLGGSRHKRQELTSLRLVELTHHLK